jgi:hypothetical protein
MSMHHHNTPTTTRGWVYKGMLTFLFILLIILFTTAFEHEETCEETRAGIQGTLALSFFKTISTDRVFDDLRTTAFKHKETREETRVGIQGTLAFFFFLKKIISTDHDFDDFRTVRRGSPLLLFLLIFEWRGHRTSSLCVGLFFNDDEGFPLNGKEVLPSCCTLVYSQTMGRWMPFFIVFLLQLPTRCTTHHLCHQPPPSCKS